MLADALYALGRYGESEQWVLRGLDLASPDDLGGLMIGLGVRSRLHARQGDISAALAAAEQVDTLAQVSEDPRDPGDAALDRAEIMYLTGDTESAQQMAQQAIDHYLRNGAVARAARVGLRQPPRTGRHTSSARHGKRRADTPESSTTRTITIFRASHSMRPPARLGNTYRRLHARLAHRSLLRSVIGAVVQDTRRRENSFPWMRPWVSRAGSRKRCRFSGPSG